MIGWETLETRIFYTVDCRFNVRIDLSNINFYQLQTSRDVSFMFQVANTKMPQACLFHCFYLGLDPSDAKAAANRGCDSKYQAIHKSDFREIGHGKQVSEQTTGEVTTHREVKGVHENLKLDDYGLTSQKTCYGRSLETELQMENQPSHQSWSSSSSGTFRKETQAQIDGVISTVDVFEKATSDKSTGAINVQTSIHRNSYDRQKGVLENEISVNFQEEKAGKIEKGRRSNMSLVTSHGSQVQVKSGFFMDYRKVTSELKNGQLTVSDEGLFITKNATGKGELSKDEKSLVLVEEESVTLRLSSHSCQGVAGALGAGLRHYLQEGKVDAKMARAAAVGGVYAWGMSVVTQSIERRVSGGGAAAFAFIEASRQTWAVLRDPTKTRTETCVGGGASVCKALVVFGGLRLASKRMIVSAASWIVPVVEVMSEACRSYWSYLNREITWARCRSNLSKAAITGTSIGLCGWGGAALGGVIGGPLGAAVGSVLGGILGEFAGTKAFAQGKRLAQLADPWR